MTSMFLTRIAPPKQWLHLLLSARVARLLQPALSHHLRDRGKDWNGKKRASKHTAAAARQDMRPKLQLQNAPQVALVMAGSQQAARRTRSQTAQRDSRQLASTSAAASCHTLRMSREKERFE